MSVKKPDLSVCMIVKNEMANISEALAGFQYFADEIVVVDTGSTDGTREAARAFTSYVYEFDWCDDFAAARNHSLEHAHGRYILWLDADDRLQPDMQDCVNRLKQHFDGSKAFHFILENYHKNGRSSTCYQLRCVPRSEEIRFTGRVHEQLLPSVVKCGCQIVKTDIAIQHFGYQDRQLCLTKLQRNLSILKKEQEDGRDDGALYFFLATTYEALGRQAEMVAALENAVARLEREVFDHHLILEGYLRLAEIYGARGEKDKALRLLMKALALGDLSPQRYFRMAMLCQKFDRHEQALSCFSKALKAGEEWLTDLYPTPAALDRKEILLSCAFSLLHQDKRRAAMGCLREAWELGLGICESWERLALKALLAKREDLALLAYETAQQSGRLSMEGFCNLGILYLSRGSRDKAKQCYQMGLQCYPYSRDLKEGLWRAVNSAGHHPVRGCSMA